MPLFNRGAPATVVPSGYHPALDRRPPGSSVGCGRLFMLLGLGIGVIAAIVVGIIAVINGGRAAASEPIPTPTSPLEALAWITPEPTPTLDAWSLTGTAIALSTATATPSPSATQDYCAFLTPTATATPTLIYTPDAWQLRGTEVWLEEHPPTETPQPQPTTPKSWCDLYLTPSPTRTRIVGTTFPTAEPTLTPSPTRRFAELVNPSQPVYTYPTVAPQYDAPPVIDQQPPQLPLPTAFPTATKTRKPTKTPTNEPTREPTATATLTLWPEATQTSLATFAPPATIPPPPTPLPPPLVVVSADCDDGVPQFELEPIGGEIVVSYRLLLNLFPLEGGVLIVQGRQSFAFLTATEPGRYHLELNGHRMARVDCAPQRVPVPDDE